MAWILMDPRNAKELEAFLHDTRMATCMKTEINFGYSVLKPGIDVIWYTNDGLFHETLDGLVELIKERAVKYAGYRIEECEDRKKRCEELIAKFGSK